MIAMPDEGFYYNSISTVYVRDVFITNVFHLSVV